MRRLENQHPDRQSQSHVRNSTSRILPSTFPAAAISKSAEKNTIIKMAQLLRDRGEAEKDDFLEVVDADRVDYASEESFWANCVKGRDSLKAVPGVQKPPRGRTEWKWAEP